MQLCLLAAGATIRLGTIALTLAWTHSIEKTRWEEDWRATPAGLMLEEDRSQPAPVWSRRPLPISTASGGVTPRRWRR